MTIIFVDSINEKIGRQTNGQIGTTTVQTDRKIDRQKDSQQNYRQIIYTCNKHKKNKDDNNGS